MSNLKTEGMATKLLKPVKREMLMGDDRGRPMIVTLEPGDMLTFRLKGKKTTYSVPLHSCFYLAMMNKMQEEYTEKMEDYKVKQSAGFKRLKKPRKPSWAVFSQRLRDVLSLGNKLKRV